MGKFAHALALTFPLIGLVSTAGAAEEITQDKTSFVLHKISEHIYAIGEPNYYQKNYSYLLVGSDRALMFDAGANQKDDITKLVRTVTNQPLSVLPSHLHFDHLGGLHNFDSIYLPDLPFVRKFQQKDGLYHVPEPVHLGNIDQFTLPPFKVSRLVKLGEKIDLGDYKVKLLSTPGHTQDEVALYDETNNILLSGDHLYPSWLLVGNLSDYIDSLSSTLKLINKDTRIYGAHADEASDGIPIMTYEDVLEIRNKMMQIQANRVQGEAFTTTALIKGSKLYKVVKDISILTNIQFTDGRRYGY
ncbi:MBL fold metallo-hydrolase [Pseudomonas aeruginosa]|uniref:MBL fold metallo-hydrolase n=1 Tax=Pseudomonas aeruginosa TaxID=287 RepID=UPI0003BAF1E7|nr:MBL fold metallo-hydrolase [Pseudomonas aeruginosa]AXN26662.1 MBL fold metallo-hydrolase [Pseudomonas aeruginosa]EIU3791080.1 MBL fold metallo-hydrolase [Pseudomonas aeruginosa]EJB8386673.1 MBL fold metallo-hydrolase [Pseudomonas aeruginosa]EJN6720174.1 MBL fold metallo-hydrolase [Pseudomonas aeruginosa]EKV0488484.1 MBL fold metallo-hydrolase [Pseudomonas aeruginosa]